MFPVQLAIIGAIPGIFVSNCNEYNTLQYPVVMHVKEHINICSDDTLALKPAAEIEQERNV
jgi:hypothetical protein